MPRTRYALKRVEARLLATDAIDALAVCHFAGTVESGPSPVYEVFMPIATVKQLTVSYDLNDLAMLRDLAVMLDGSVMDRLTLSHSAAENRHLVLHALHAHREWLAKNPDLFQAFHHFLCMLSTAFVATEDDLNALIRLSEVLAVACRIIAGYNYPEESHLHGMEALKDAPHIALMLHHANHIPELLQYRHERGMDRTAVMEAHDEQDFLNYLAQHSAVKSGWL